MYIDRSVVPPPPEPGAIDPFISNGTCYFKAGQKTSGSFIPCGNAAIGHQTCCAATDACLSDNACQSQEFSTNYLVGCTDPTYRHSSCPDKFEEEDLPWAPIVLCTKADGVWQTCPQASKPMEMGKPETPCACIGEPQKNKFKHPGQSTLDYLAVLPSVTGSIIRFEPGYSPTISSTAPAATTTVFFNNPGRGPDSSAEANAAGSSPTAGLSGATDIPVADQGLSTGAKAGIGGGVGGAALIAIGALIFFLLRRRRTREVKEEHQEQEQHRQRHIRTPLEIELMGDEPPPSNDEPAKKYLTPAPHSDDKMVVVHPEKEFYEPDTDTQPSQEPSPAPATTPATTRATASTGSPTTMPVSSPSTAASPRGTFAGAATAARTLAALKARLARKGSPSTSASTVISPESSQPSQFPPRHDSQPAQFPPRHDSIAHPAAVELETPVNVTELPTTAPSIRSTHQRPLSVSSVRSARSGRSEAGSVRSLWRPSSTVPPLPTDARAAVFAAASAPAPTAIEEDAMEMTGVRRGMGGMAWDDRPVPPPKPTKPVYEMPS